MKIKLISDLHFGVKGDPSNDFLLDEDAFTLYLQDSIREYDSIILVGDTFELWERLLGQTSEEEGTSGEAKYGTIPWIKERMKKRMERIVSSWKFMPEILNNPKIGLINGNHDSMIRTDGLITTKNVTDHVILELAGHRVFVAHGHQGDFFNADRSPLKWLSCCCKESVSGLEKLIDKNLDHDVAKLTNSPLLSNTDNITKYADKLAKTVPCELVIFGHTHQAGIIRHDNRYYINTGCVVGKKDVIDEVTIESDDVRRSVHCSCHQIDVVTRTITNPLVVNL